MERAERESIVQSLRVSVAVVLAVSLGVIGCDVGAPDPASVAPVAPAASATAAPPTKSAGSSWDLQPTLVDLVESAYPGGANAVIVGVFDGADRWTAATGFDGDGVGVSDTTVWEGASISKMIVGAAVMQLVDQGLVDLDAPIATYLDADIDRSISVRHVLAHESGIASMQHQLSQCPTEATIAEAIDLAEAADGPEEADYSNTNYLLLGHLVDQVSGLDVGEYTKVNIFGPLGMDDTYWWETQQGPTIYAQRPRSDTGSTGPYACDQIETTVGTEGLTFATTLDDMDAFLRGLFSGDLVSEAALTEMLPTGEQENGLGIWADADDERGTTLLGHPGGRDGFTTVAYFDPDTRRTIVAFATGGAQAEELMRGAWDWAEGQAP